jgi:glycogen operon protein
VQKLTKLRHQYPILRRSRFLPGAYHEDLGVKYATWINASGAAMEHQNRDETNVQRSGMPASAALPGSRRPTQRVAPPKTGS